MKNLAVMLLLFMIILPAVIVAEVDPLDPWGHSEHVIRGGAMRDLKTFLPRK